MAAGIKPLIIAESLAFRGHRYGLPLYLAPSGAPVTEASVIPALPVRSIHLYLAIGFETQAF